MTRAEALERGDKVRIVEGPHRGVEGLVTTEATVRGARVRVVVPVNGRLTELEFTRGQVRPL